MSVAGRRARDPSFVMCWQRIASVEAGTLSHNLLQQVGAQLTLPRPLRRGARTGQAERAAPKVRRHEGSTPKAVTASPARGVAREPGGV